MAVSPMRPKGPPLNALRAFEAAARLGSFAAAAEELCVTAGAVSQQIKSLEDWAQVTLFHRRAQGVSLTPAGTALIPTLGTAFDALGQAVRDLRQSARHTALHIAAMPSVAQLWLSPRLRAIRRALPDVQISVTVTEAPPNLARELFDASLFMREPASAPGALELVDDTIFPVCTPALAARITTPQDLAHHTLLHDQAWARDWPLWARAAGLNGAHLTEGPQFSLYALALDEAKAGAGILMGHACLVQPALEDGSLCRPFAQSVATGSALMLETPPAHAPSTVTRRLIDVLTANQCPPSTPVRTE
ncbi:LysR substrate-binding domain-containing protein [Octadecabacter sp. R77987]|uniref:LysR substrate-binding domain-containing protein n=1 Tax=Octadecabacter sp. R77987 TaxID=3093874 RepID=UPI0036721A4A